MGNPLYYYARRAESVVLTDSPHCRVAAFVHLVATLSNFLPSARMSTDVIKFRCHQMRAQLRVCAPLAQACVKRNKPNAG